MRKPTQKGVICLLFSLTFFGMMASVDANAATRYDVTIDGPSPVSGSDTEPDYYGVQKLLNQINGISEEVIVYFPAGTYYLPQALRVYSNTHIILDDNATLVRIDDGVNKNIIHNVDANGAMDQTGGYEMSENITIEGGIFDGGDVSGATKAADLVRIDHAKNVTIKNCTFQNVYDCHHLELIGVKKAVVSGCTFKNFIYRRGEESNYMLAREALQLETAWTDDINDPSKAWAKGSVIDGTSCKSVKVTGCTFDNIPCCVGQHHFSEDGNYRNEDIEISNNTLTYKSSIKNGKTAITCCGMDRLKVFGNVIDGDYKFMMHVDEADDVLIQNNKLSNGYQNGIMVDGGTLINIKNNTIKKFKKSGISVLGGSVGSGKNKKKGITGNTISDCKLNGITISDSCKVSSISKNKIKKIKGNGISMSGKAKVVWVQKNTIKNYGGRDIYNGLGSKVKIS